MVDLPDSWPLSAADDLRDEVLAAYADPTRGYHDTRHLTEVLGRLDEIADAGVAYDRLPVVLAAWFHDGVYDGERDAEERSAIWAEEALAPILEPAVVAEVARLVRLTETHLPEDDDANGSALSDADLAILAAPDGRYAEYVAAVRAEFAHVDDESFRFGRSEVLRGLLAKPHLFHTPYARASWEDAARANVERELAGLETRP
ncbi:MAG: hypothetical protein JWO11_1692 [Nocardioides sp.]|nr:hypothetical protein [Nocardioides sp.]